MNDTDSLSQARQTVLDYQARFGDLDHQAFKLANQSGAGNEFHRRLQNSLDSNTPMDFVAFGKELLMPSAGASKAAPSSSMGLTTA